MNPIEKTRRTARMLLSDIEQAKAALEAKIAELKRHVQALDASAEHVRKLVNMNADEAMEAIAQLAASQEVAAGEHDPDAPSLTDLKTCTLTDFIYEVAKRRAPEPIGYEEILQAMKSVGRKEATKSTLRGLASKHSMLVSVGRGRFTIKG